MATFSWDVAEALALAHMRQIGFADAKRTPPGADKGLDAVSERAAAQVKAKQDPVGAPDLQKLKGAASNYEFLLFYSLSGYTTQATEYAANANIALFTFDKNNNVLGFNDAARWLDGSSNPTAKALKAANDAESLANHIKGFSALLPEITNWLKLSPWPYLVPQERLEAAALGISASTIGFTSFQLRATLLSSKASPEEVTDFSADVRGAVGKLVESLGQSIGVNFSGKTPEEARKILKESLRQYSDELEFHELKDSVQGNFVDAAAAWKFYLPIVPVVIRAQKFLKAMNEEVREIEEEFSIDVDSDDRCQGSRKTMKGIVDEFSNWANQAFDHGQGNAPAGERLLLAGVDEYQNLASKFKRDAYETLAFSDSQPATWLDDEGGGE